MPVSRDTSHLWTAQRRPEWRLTVVRPDEPEATPPVLDGLDDRALATRAGAGDRDAFDVLVVRHQRAVYQVCFRFLRDHAEAERRDAGRLREGVARACRGSRATPRLRPGCTGSPSTRVCRAWRRRRPAADPSPTPPHVADPRQSQATWLAAAGAGSRRAPGRRSIARPAARHGHPSRLPRSAARRHRGRARQLGRIGESQLLSRAPESAATARRGPPAMSRHLSDDEIVELLKATDTVPEPSPLFWEHAARRVRAAVDAEPRRLARARPARVDGRRAGRGVDCRADRLAAAPIECCR